MRQATAAKSRYSVYGVPTLQPLIKMPKEAVPGQPFSVRVVWAPESVRAALLTLSVDGRPLDVFEEGVVHVGLASVPLGTPPGEGVVGLELTDEYGREVTRHASLDGARRLPPCSRTPHARRASGRLDARKRGVRGGGFARHLRPRRPDVYIPTARALPPPHYGPQHQRLRYAAALRARRCKVIYHEGADIAAPVGTPVRATNAGRVLVADFFPIKGGLVVLDHGAGVVEPLLSSV